MKAFFTALIGFLFLTNFQPIQAQNFYLHPNGVTCMCPDAAMGESGEVNGVTYTKRTRDQITSQNASTTCTSGITDMSDLFWANSIDGDISSWDVSNVTKMTEMFKHSIFNQPIDKWDVSNVTDMSHMFANSYFNQPIGNWDVSSVSNMYMMFYGSRFNQPIGNWNVSNVVDMGKMFWFNTYFNQDIGNWDVSNVVDMGKMFDNAIFNRPLENWDVGNVTNMYAMFANSAFNQPIANWNVSNVINMSEMFTHGQFNYPIENWDVGNVTNMSWMFYYSPFNQPLGNWDVSKVTNMTRMFSSTPFNQLIDNWDVSNVTSMPWMFNNSNFNQPLENWDVSNVISMANMFSGTPFNQPIGNWDVSNVTNMEGMFVETSFNQPIGNWDVSNVIYMSGMFFNSQFNQPIGNWDVGNVVYMKNVFLGSSFNQPIGNWDVSNVINMSSMFSHSQFNQSIVNWDVSNVINMTGMFWYNYSFNQDISTWTFSPYVIFSFLDDGFISGGVFSVENYDLLLQSFSDQDLQNKIFIADGLVYCNSDARNDLINNKGWTIIGDLTSPRIFAPNNLTVFADQGKCEATNVNIGMPTVQSCLNYTINNNAPEIYPIGTTEVLWTIIDDNGTTVSDVQNITVVLDIGWGFICYVSNDDLLGTKNRIFINNLNWNNVKHYEILRATSTNSFQPIGVIVQEESSFLDTTSNNTTQAYKYSLRTVDVCENISSSYSIHKTIHLQSNIAVNNTVTLTWNNYEGINFDDYKIYRKINSGDFELIALGSYYNPVYTDNQANVLENTYEYYVAIDAPLCFTGSRFTTVEIKSNKAVIGPDGILDDFLKNQVIIHPNPLFNTLNIMLPENITLSSGIIYNTLGQKVMTIKTTSFSVEHLPQSNYYIKVLTSKGEVTKPFIKF
jgi:surface protein